MPIGDYDKAFSLAEDYLSEFGGDIPHFGFLLTDHQRLGQAFFNSLSDKDKERVRATKYDPFYRTDPDVIFECVDFLLTFDD